jgi:hypothetical protein
MQAIHLLLNLVWFSMEYGRVHMPVWSKFTRGIRYMYNCTCREYIITFFVMVYFTSPLHWGYAWSGMASTASRGHGYVRIWAWPGVQVCSPVKEIGNKIETPRMVRFEDTISKYSCVHTHLYALECTHVYPYIILKKSMFVFTSNYVRMLHGPRRKGAYMARRPT